MVTPAAHASSGEHRHDLVLRIMDHQIVGASGRMLGNVDDAVLERSSTDWVVTGLVVGPYGLGRRLPGRLGTWTLAIWRRLHPDSDPEPLIVPVGEVTSIDS